MTEKQILAALTYMDNQYIDSAQKKLGYLSDSRKSGRVSSGFRTLRRALSLGAAVLLLTSVLFMTAMAASKEFREFIFRFFQVEQTEFVPERNAETNPFGVEEEQVDIGGILKGTYIHTPLASNARNGIYMVCTDDVMMNSGNHYDAYKLENGEFIQLEKHLFSGDYTVQGADIHIEFEWAEHNGAVSITYIDADAPYRIYGMSGDAEGVLMELSLPHSYPVVMNLRTGEIRDVLAGTGAEAMQDIGQAALTEDRSKMLLATWEEKLYCADLVEKKLYDLDAISGEHVQECVVFGNTVTCMVLEGDSIENALLGRCRAWNIALETMERKEILSIAATPATSHDVWSINQEDLQFDENGNLIHQEETKWNQTGIHFLSGFSRSSHWGNMYAGSQFAVEVDAQRNVWVINLENGEKSLIPGYQWHDIPYPVLECQPCPDGKKLLIYSRATANYHEFVGVLDFEKKAYFEFDRENRAGIHENLVYWFGYDSIMITGEDGTWIREYYLYELTAEDKER